MIIYRPNRGLLIEAMRDAQEFENFESMQKYIVEQANRDGRDILSIEDIVIKPIDSAWGGGEDSRCGWEDTMHVCTKRYGNVNYIEKYGSAQCIGMCATKYSPYDREYWKAQKYWG